MQTNENNKEQKPPSPWQRRIDPWLCVKPLQDWKCMCVSLRASAAFVLSHCEREQRHVWEWMGMHIFVSVSWWLFFSKGMGLVGCITLTSNSLFYLNNTVAALVRGEYWFTFTPLRDQLREQNNSLCCHPCMHWPVHTLYLSLSLWQTHVSQRRNPITTTVLGVVPPERWRLRQVYEQAKFYDYECRPGISAPSARLS